mgnify:CR=1 FL=1|jgi:hypothetical protein
MATQKHPKPQHIGGVGRKKAAKRPKRVPPAACGVQLDIPGLDFEFPGVSLDLSTLDYPLPKIPDTPLPDFTLPDIALDPLPDFNLDLPAINLDLDEGLPTIEPLDLSAICGTLPPKRRKRPRRT